MIEIDRLTQADVGRSVLYHREHCDRQHGKLSSWNSRFVFVQFRGPGGEACEPGDVSFCNIEKTHWPESQVVDGLALDLTCASHPEQYDVHDPTILTGEPAKIGYLRLRDDVFRARVDGPSGKVVYEAKTRGHGWFNEDERQEHLEAAVKAIKVEIAQRMRAAVESYYIGDGKVDK